MGGSTEIFSFRVITDRGEVYGPFDMRSRVYPLLRYRPDGKRLRFENVDASGGNTGAVEIEVYGEPAP